MSETIVEEKLVLREGDAVNILGKFDEHAKKIEKTLGVSLVLRDDFLRIIGRSVSVAEAKKTIEELIRLSHGGNTVTEQSVDYILSLSFKEKENALTDLDSDNICLTVSGKMVKPKTLGQKKYIDEIRNKMIVFAKGPAGTGKTYLAIAMAAKAFRGEEVNRIILTRPAIEAGEKLGFLPGDIQSKIDPYLRPLYDAMYQIMGAESVQKNTERGLIEVAPLAYMRGRTLDNAFIILDEAQNTTPSQMKMFLTRIGFGSKVVITGDATQKDLPKDTVSGLDVATKILKNVDEIGFCDLTSKDVVRHPLVQKIVEAYEKYEKKTTERKKSVGKGKDKK